MNTLVLSPDIDMRRAWTRLSIAVALSLLLHVVLLLGMRINPTGGVPDVTSTATTITAQLAPPSDIVAPAADDAVPSAPATAVAAPVSSPSRGIVVPLARDPNYYSARQLEVYPQPTELIRPPYPAAALDAHVNGEVTLLLLIDEFGVVTEASVVKADPPGYFEDATVNAFRAARFKPGRRDGHAVKSRVQIKVNYDYENERLARQR